jgi:dihydroflavonol-4-reductase
VVKKHKNSTFANLKKLIMILVTGGTGLVGSHLLFELVRSGKPVRATYRKTSNRERIPRIFSYYSDDPGDLYNRIEWIEADLMDFGSMEDAFEGIDEVYHAGAVVSYFPEDHKRMLRVNIEGTANLVNLSLGKNLNKFCYVSSIATLGRADNNNFCDEETFWKPSKKNSVYSISKYGAEREVWRGMEEGLNALIVNPSMILGPGFWEEKSGLFRLVWEGLKYYTRGVNGYVDVRDVVKAIILLMEKNQFGNRFIISSENLSYQQLFKMIAKHLGKPAPTINVPLVMTNVAWRVEAVRSFIMRSRPEVTSEMAVTTAQKYYYSNEKIRRALNFEFISVEQSIQDICRIFLAEHKFVTRDASSVSH